MDLKALKEYIYENNKIEYLLEQTGCHHIKYHPHGNPDPFWSCANYDGNNPSAINVYNKPSLKTINYTRDMTEGKDIPTDLITLICFSKKLSLFEGLKNICNEIGLNYYHNFDEDVPESLRITKLILDLNKNFDTQEDERPLKPISEKILIYYKPYINDMFANDGISYETQKEFEIGYDDFTNRIIIPIRDEIGSLIGVKGRLLKKQLEEWELKYIYLEPCARSKILYGLYKTYPYIKREGKCFIGEAEKFVLQLWDMDYQYAVGIGGTKVTEQQIEKLTRLGVDLIFAFDRGIEKKELENIADRFIDGVNIYCMFDDKNILNDKESPSDNKEKFEYLYKNCLYKIK
jgi:DNA primase